MTYVRTIVLGDPPAELQRLLASRRATGADLYDEVWEGEYHMAPAPRSSHGRVDDEMAAVLRPWAKRAGLFATGPFNLGTSDDYRVPDRALRRDERADAFIPTAALVVEIVSPDDETWDKLDFYAGRGVDELVIADPADQTVAWMRLVDGRYEPTERSAVLDVDVADVVAEIDWPPAG